MESFISCALPGIGEEVIQKLDAKLQDIGVIEFDDLQYVEEEHIKDALKPIQLKKFFHFCKKSEIIPREDSAPAVENIAQTTSTPSIIEVENEPTTSTPSIIEVENEPTTSTMTNRPNPILSQNWAAEFAVPFDAFPKGRSEANEKGQQPSKLCVTDMVRTMVTQIMNVTETHGRKNLRAIASKIINKYPASFNDKWGDTVVGDGVTSLMKRLENCIDNRKRMRGALEECYIGAPKKRKTQRESYGCVLWQPSSVPEGQTQGQPALYQKWLKEEYPEAQKDEARVRELMERCYGMQRYFINNVKSSVASVQEEWPFLLEEEEMLAHTLTLLGKDIGEVLSVEIPRRGKKIYDYMKTQTKLPLVTNCIREIELSKVELENVKPEFIGAIPLLMAHFGEEKSLLVKEKLSPDDIDRETLLTPYLVTFGNNIYNAREYALVIDGKVCTYSSTFPKAMAILFASYFIFNIEYNVDTAATMEFIQRCIADINPPRGTKVSRKEKVKHSSITKKVTNLANAINNFEKVFKLYKY